MKFLAKGLVTLFLITIGEALHAQVKVELTDRIKYPEVHFYKHLHDIILSANQGVNFSNYASVKFNIDKKGIIGNILFSTYTDSLVMPHIYNVLISTKSKMDNPLKREGHKRRGSYTFTYYILL
jgi:hypothetical protein